MFMETENLMHMNVVCLCTTDVRVVENRTLNYLKWEKQTKLRSFGKRGIERGRMVALLTHNNFSILFWIYDWLLKIDWKTGQIRNEQLNNFPLHSICTNNFFSKLKRKKAKRTNPFEFSILMRIGFSYVFSCRHWTNGCDIEQM